MLMKVLGFPEHDDLDIFIGQLQKFGKTSIVQDRIFHPPRWAAGVDVG